MYASSEGLSTLMLDRLGPGGQAGGSLRIENFIGFPAGLSGADLATRGVLQMLKFGAQIVTPVTVEKLTPAKKADDLHVLHLDCGQRFAVEWCFSPWAFVGDDWKPLERTVSRRRASITPARRWKPTFMTVQTSRWSAPVTQPARPSCFWLSAAPRGGTCSSAARSVLACRSTCRVGSVRPPLVVHEQTEIDAVDGRRRLEEISLNGKGIRGIAQIALFGGVCIHWCRASGRVATG